MSNIIGRIGGVDIVHGGGEPYEVFLGEMAKSFAERGYLHVRGPLSQDGIAAFENAVIDLYMMQAGKIGEYRDLVRSIRAMREECTTRYDIICTLVKALEATDKAAAYQVQKMFTRSQRVRSLFDDFFMNLCGNLIGANPATTLIDGPALFVNQPTVNRLLYRWHTEALYYPKRRRFVNVWLPMFAPRTVENGAMSLRVGSHKRAWTPAEISEYGGWDKAAEGKRDQFVQLEVCENFLTEYPRHECVSEPGDAILFDRNLVHTSNPNVSDSPAFAVVCRVWDPTDDLTLSGDMEVTFGNNLGRAGLVVRP